MSIFCHLWGFHSCRVHAGNTQDIFFRSGADGMKSALLCCGERLYERSASSGVYSATWQYCLDSYEPAYRPYRSASDPDGEANARRLGERLKGMQFARVFASPLQRASRTCELSGFGEGAEIDPDLVEWDYGEYEGLTTAEILRQRPDWQLFRDGCPRGESPAQVGERADRVVQRARSVAGDVLLFSSGHFIRVLTARWLALAPGTGGRYFLLNPASLSALGYEHNLSRPVIRLWNDDHHVAAGAGAVA